jgi:hypothetical protein
MARDNEAPCTEGLSLLPTGKYHISFSELSDWVECPFRHKLKHIDKINIPDRSHYLDFGIAVHAACENYLRTGKMDAAVATDIIHATWKKYKHAENDGKIADLEACIAQAEGICAEVHEWMSATFPNWEVVSPEHFLYERIGEKPHAFKGYIDAVIKVTTTTRGGKKKVIYWLLDWKTTTWGWNRAKKSDKHKQRQLIYYKNFWAQETGIDPKSIRCGFVLLKRTAKPGAKCELIPVSVGAVSTGRSLKVVNNMLSSVKKGMSFKNKYNCQWCVYKDTPHCP